MLHDMPSSVVKSKFHSAIAYPGFLYSLFQPDLSISISQCGNALLVPKHMFHSISSSGLQNVKNRWYFLFSFRGRFSVVAKAIEKSSDKVVVAKLLEFRPDTEGQVNREFEALRSLRHERIATLEAAFKPAGSTVAVLILEKLQGADILTYLSSRHEYSEQTVATVVSQVGLIL